MWILKQFDTENYTWRIDIVQNLFELWHFFLSYFWAQNVSIPPDQNMPQGTKCFNIPSCILLTLLKHYPYCSNIIIVAMPLL